MSCSLIRAIVYSVVFLVLIAGRAAAQDTVILYDGRMYTGRIVDENTVMIEIDTTVSGIATRLKIERSRISSLVRGHDQWVIEDEGATPEAEESDREIGLKVMEIPLQGTFGRDVLPIGFRRSLDHAKRHGVTHIVLRIKSPGGFLWASEQILEFMEANRSQFTFHALVEESISAAIWPTFASETIHIAPGGSIGGAVAFTRNTSGNAEVDAKFNAVLASKLVAVAEKFGHNSDVIRAMILMDSELYAVDEGEAMRLTSTMPRDAGYETVATRSSVLSLTTREAEKYGVAVVLSGGTLAELMESLAIEEWVSVDSGARIMGQWRTQCQRRLDVVVTLRQKLEKLVKDYEDATTYDQAISILTSFQNEHPRFARAVRDALECYSPDDTIEPAEVRELSRKVRELIQELREQKRKNP